MNHKLKNRLETVPVEDAVGKVLLHDITRIVPDVFKGPYFRKGHIIRAEDIEKLLDIGKKNIYVADLEGAVHENEASRRIAYAAAGKGVGFSDPKEGMVRFRANYKGFLKVNKEALLELNSVEDIIFSTLHTDQVLETDKEFAGTRVIPLFVEEEKVAKAEDIIKRNYPLIEVKEISPLRIGLVITGSEVYSGRIEDRFGPVVEKKFSEFKCPIIRKEIVSDELEMTVSKIKGLIDDNAQLIAVTGGMSVDPDDLTPSSIKAAGGEIVTYGAPVLPGAMFMLAYIGDVPVVGLPGCVMYNNTSVFDLVIPKILAGEKITKRDIVELGHGGFCLNCKVCRYPDCSYGK